VHAYKPIVLHVDFQRVDAKKKLHQKIPLHFVNQDIAPGVKLEGGQIAHVITELEISCLPADLPEFIEVDLKDLTTGASVHVSHLQLPKGVSPIVHGEDQTVASCIAKKGGAVEEDETVAAEAPAAAPAADAAK
jgi:large subunit ribosomal protein L25